MLDYKKTYTLPFKFVIPNYIDEFLKKRSITKFWVKYIKRYLYILFKGQQSLEILKISKEHKDILWINFSAPSIGDSLMDLSSRALLSDRRVDLLTDKKNVNLYHEDWVFSSVHTNPKDVNKKSYDLVIIDSYSTRSIKMKTQVTTLTPYIGMYGYFNGPEVNRVLFSFHKMNSLLGYIKSESDINKVAKSSISISYNDQKLIQKLSLPDEYIAIALGGEWSYRTYDNWPEVIKKLLIKDNNLKIILLGSENANAIEKKIIEIFPSLNVMSYVAKFTFNQTSEIINQAKLLICCDGGLMHAANAVETPIIPLFARLQEQMQLTSSIKAFPIFDPTNVNNILVKDIIQKYNEATKLDHNHPRDG